MPVPSSRIAPVAALGAAGIAVAYVSAVDDPPWLPPCEFHATTGLWCPGCGLTRAARAAAGGDVARALSHNVLAPAFVLAMAVAWVGWWRRAQGRPGPRVPGWLSTAAVVIAIAFGVARNVPVGPLSALAP